MTLERTENGMPSMGGGNEIRATVEAALAQPQNTGAAALAPKQPSLNDVSPSPPPQPDVLGGAGRGGAGGIAVPDFVVGTPFEKAYQKALDTARAAVARRASGMLSPAPTSAQSPVATPTIASMPATAPTTTPVPAPTAPSPTPTPAPQIKTVALGGGKSAPAYDYGGSTILIADGIDVNDPAAVQNYMTETNDLIDMMNEAYA